MSERVLARLADWLAQGPVVLASVLSSRGATPRKAGAMMLVRADETYGSVGGGEAEARVLRAAQLCLQQGETAAAVEIDLGGGPQAAGICGGRMQVALRRLHGDEDLAWVELQRQLLAQGLSIELSAAELGVQGGGEIVVSVMPDPRLLIIGAGHCGLALYELARLLDFEIWVFDEREADLAPQALPDAVCRSGEIGQLREALDTRRPVLAVLLTRNYHCDVAALRLLAESPPQWTGMMGSRKRIRQVLAELGDQVESADGEQFRLAGCPLVAPVGLAVGAETPHEIAVSILAQLLAVLRLGRAT